MYVHATVGKKQLCSVIKNNSWEVPAIFDELIKRGADPKNVYSTFNMGIGFVLAVAKEDAPKILKAFNTNAKKYSKKDIPDMKAYEIGYVGHTTKTIKGEFKGNKEMTQFID